MDDVRIDEEDIAVFRKVLAYYYLCDAFTWCRPGTGHVSNRRTKSAATCSSSAPHPFHSSTLGL